MRAKTIYCPVCNRRVAYWDGKQESNIVSGCKKCKKKIIYEPSTGKIEIKSIENRETSSGVRFYY